MPTKEKVTRWQCRCDCGNELVMRAPSLNQGRTKSCGCLLTKVLVKRNFEHGKTKTRAHVIWASMLTRCTNPKAKAYKKYGGRGISVCEEWKTFTNFFNDMGDCPDKFTLERVNNNGGYFKENCVWADRKAQARNRRSNHMITHNGESKCIAEWAEIKGIKIHTLKRRLTHGTYSIEKSLNSKRLPNRKAVP